MPDDVRSLYLTAANGLQRSSDAELETIRQQISNGKPFEASPSPITLAKLYGGDEVRGARAFADLSQAGFVETQMTGYSWASLDPGSTGFEFDTLAAIEAAVALRFTYRDCSEVVPSLSRQAARIMTLAEQGFVLDFCFEVQRFFLALVASANVVDLIKLYAYHARASLAYAWAAGLNPETLPATGEAFERIMRYLEAKEGRKAAIEMVRIRLAKGP